MVVLVVVATAGARCNRLSTCWYFALLLGQETEPHESGSGDRGCPVLACGTLEAQSTEAPSGRSAILETRAIRHNWGYALWFVPQTKEKTQNKEKKGLEVREGYAVYLFGD